MLNKIIKQRIRLSFLGLAATATLAVPVSVPLVILPQLPLDVQRQLPKNLFIRVRRTQNVLVGVLVLLFRGVQPQVGHAEFGGRHALGIVPETPSSREQRHKFYFFRGRFGLGVDVAGARVVLFEIALHRRHLLAAFALDVRHGLHFDVSAIEDVNFKGSKRSD